MTDTLADRIARAHNAPDGFTGVQHVADPWEGDPISLTDIIRELQARLAVAEDALKSGGMGLMCATILESHSKGDESVAELVHYVQQIEQHTVPALKIVNAALAACDLTKPFGENNHEQ